MRWLLAGITALFGLSCATGGILLRNPKLKPLLYEQSVSESVLNEAMQNEPNESTWYAMLQAFAILRSSPLRPSDIAQAHRYFEKAEQTFSDLADPINFHVAFTQDASLPYRGRPHERVMTAMMLGLLDMANGRCDLALPALREAEFLDARWQAVSFGTDAPMIYALMLRCLWQTNASDADIERARQGLHRSIRMLALQEPLERILRDVLQAQARYHSVAVQVAHLLLELGISNALMASRKDAVEGWLEDAIGDANLRLSNLKDQFDSQYEQVIWPMMASAGRVGFGERNRSKLQLENVVFQRVPFELDRLSKQLKDLIAKKYKQDIQTWSNRYQSIASSVEHASLRPRLLVQFKGFGPRIEQEGNYKEIARIVPSKTGQMQAGVREQMVDAEAPCGLSRSKDGALLVGLCEAGLPGVTKKKPWKAYELWSSTYQATSMMGRRFERILKGRAQFRSTTATVAVLGLASSLFFLDLGSRMMAECQSKKRDSTCETIAWSLYGAAGITLVLGGTVWLLGLTVNPAADPRYVPGLYESGFLLVD